MNVAPKVKNNAFDNLTTVFFFFCHAGHVMQSDWLLGKNVYVHWSFPAFSSWLHNETYFGLRGFWNEVKCV